MAFAFAALPANLTSINLMNNELANLPDTELAVAFAALPAHLTSINLCFNRLYTKTGAELAVIFAALPAHLTSINLSDNNLGKKTGVELAVAFAAIPDHITSINLSWNDFEAMSLIDLESLANTLPHIRNLCLSSYEIINMSPEKVRAFKNIFCGIQYNEENIRFAYQDFEPSLHASAYIPLKRLGIVPSLKMTSAFFVRRHLIPAEEGLGELPQAVIDYLKI